jgi:3-dehydroquinate synthase
MLTIDVAMGDRSYPVIIGKGVITDSETWQRLLPGGKLMVVSNETVAPLYLENLCQSLKRDLIGSHVLQDGERFKTLSSWSGIIDDLVESKAGRDVCLIALGGGVVGDVCGFAAASYMRGVPFIQVPTTLLAQVDASVGGKTAVNHEQGKNLIGAFHQPRAVLIDTDTLATLPEREFKAGLAEVVKCAVIRDPGFFDWLESHTNEILQKDSKVLNAMIERSVRNKAEVVEKDELESGERALLNFGHTFGHALETLTAYTRLLHGEAVAIGMVAATRLSEIRGLCPSGTADRISSLLMKLTLPSTLPGGIESDRIIQAMALDKKVLGGEIRLILTNGIGSAVIDSKSTRQQIQTALAQSR